MCGIALVLGPGAGEQDATFEAMLGAVAGLASEQGVEVVGFEAADVSYPGFADDLEKLLG